MKKLKKAKLLEGDMIDYQDRIFIYQESELFFFDSQNTKLLNFSTNDYMVAVAALMKIKDVYSFEKLWDLQITNTMRDNINIKNTLYWITGGDREWEQNNLYNDTWDNCSSIFVQAFEKTLTKINKEAKTLKDCREAIIKKLSLPDIYEFSLRNGLIK